MGGGGGWMARVGCKEWGMGDRWGAEGEGEGERVRVRGRARGGGGVGCGVYGF